MSDPSTAGRRPPRSRSVSFVTANKNVPPVQVPVANSNALHVSVSSLKQGMESLGGYRGVMAGRAVTFTDLADLGLVTPITHNTTTGTVTSGVVAGAELDEEVAARIAADADLQNQIDAVGGAFKFTTVPSTDGVFTSDEIAGTHEVIIMMSGSGATALTTPTADEIIAGVPFWEVGGMYRFRICNPTPGTITITPGTGVTITGLTTCPTNKWREWLVRYTAANAVDFRDIGSGDA